MRGLPPLPAGIVTFNATIEVNGSEVGITQHAYSAGAAIADETEFDTWLNNWFNFCSSHLLALMPVESTFRVLRLTRVGLNPLVVETVPAHNAGAFGSCQSLNTATCLTWSVAIAGYQSRAHTRLPIGLENVDGGKRRVNKTFQDQANSEAQNYLGAFNANLTLGGDSCELVVVSRAIAGQPRASAVFSPVVAGSCSPRVATLASRTKVSR